MSGKRGQKGTGSIEISEKFNADFMAELDGRVKVSKTLRQRLGSLASDLGGIEQLSYREQSISRRCVHLERQVERFEMTLAHGGTLPDFQSYLSAITTLSSLYSKLGKQDLKRQPKMLGTIPERMAAMHRVEQDGICIVTS